MGKTVGSLTFHYLIAWHTPEKYIEAARSMLGTIDLDPATDELAQKRIKATKYYTAETNGLDKPWHGNVLMCPPWIPGQRELFVDKAVEEYKLGHSNQTLVLVHTKSTWESWFQKLISECSSACFIGELIQWEPGHVIPDIIRNVVAVPKYDERGSVFFYFGRDIIKFKDVFSTLGAVI